LNIKYSKVEKNWCFLNLKNDNGSTEKKMKNKFEYAIAELSNLKPKTLRDKKFSKFET
tara:strand:+ start:186 stop:359 length:174 start_codon:yes stop_codon:yes gene_type:complete